ncbi:hypothetical protein S245_039298, partial [Arachis hypogaea]
MDKRKTSQPKHTNDTVSKSKKSKGSSFTTNPEDLCFVGNRISSNETRAKWPARYKGAVT